MSANAKTKATSIGLASGPSAESEGFGRGQPTVKIMGREVRVLARLGWEAQEGERIDGASPVKGEGDGETAIVVKEELESDAGAQQMPEAVSTPMRPQRETAYWGLDLEALRSLNTNTASTPGRRTSMSTLPIYTPQSARAYLQKSFASASPASASASAGLAPAKRRSAAALAAEKEANLAMLLQALDMVFVSWSTVLVPEELDRRAWGWYVRVRPDVQGGQAGWGAKGEVRLGDILELRRKE